MTLHGTSEAAASMRSDFGFGLPLPTLCSIEHDPRGTTGRRPAQASVPCVIARAGVATSQMASLKLHSQPDT